MPENLKQQQQREDPTLQKAYDRVMHIDGASTGVPTTLAGDGYLLQDGFLYHQPDEGRAEQLVVPKQFRAKVKGVSHGA